MPLAGSGSLCADATSECGGFNEHEPIRRPESRAELEPSQEPI